MPKVPSPFLIGDFNAAVKELLNVSGYLVQRFGVVAHVLSVTVATPDPQAINVTFNEGNGGKATILSVTHGGPTSKALHKSHTASCYQAVG